MSRGRYISPYFSAIGWFQSLLIFLEMLVPFRNTPRIRAKLSEEISRRFEDVECFSYVSARGALAGVLDAMELDSEAEVLLSSFTCLAVPTAVIAAGARPIYCDIDPKTMNMTVDTVIAAITPKTQVVVVQHTLGSIAPVAEIRAVLLPRGIWVIEDCALSYGSKFRETFVGSFGDAAIFSMELSKTLTVGWGGILLVKNKKLAHTVAKKYSKLPEVGANKSWRMAFQTAVSGIFYMPNFHGFGMYGLALFFKLGLFQRSTPDLEYQGEVADDFCSKLAVRQCVLALHQWRRAERVFDACTNNFIKLRSMLMKLGYVPLGTTDSDSVPVSPRISFLVADRDAAIAYFHEHGVELGAWFDGPLSPLPKALVFHYNRDDYPMALKVSKHIVNLVCHSRLTAADLRHIENTLIGYQRVHGHDKVLQQWVDVLIKRE